MFNVASCLNFFTWVLFYERIRSLRLNVDSYVDKSTYSKKKQALFSKFFVFVKVVARVCLNIITIVDMLLYFSQNLYLLTYNSYTYKQVKRDVRNIFIDFCFKLFWWKILNCSN